LPPDVTASSGYDHRGQCIVFEHKTLGELGRIVLVNKGEKNTLLQSDLRTEGESMESLRVKKKRQVFEELLTIVHACFDENFPG